MKVVIDDQEKIVSVLNCTGYRATAITLDIHDLRVLAKLPDPRPYIAQLAGRVRDDASLR